MPRTRASDKLAARGIGIKVDTALKPGYVLFLRTRSSEQSPWPFAGPALGVLHLEHSEKDGGAWLAQLERHASLDLRVVSLSPILGMEIT